MTIINHITKYLACPFVVILAVTSACAFSLAMAYTAEYAFDLKPCILCLYQRIPFAIVLGLGILIFALTALLKNKDLKKTISKITVGIMGLTMLGNSALAAFHTGVEQKWWTFGTEGCAVPKLSNDPQTLIDRILSTPSVPCDEIAWSDPLLGLSIANYNIIWCLGLALICFASLILKRRAA